MLHNLRSHLRTHRKAFGSSDDKITAFLKTITLIIDPPILYNSICSKLNDIFAFDSLYLFLFNDLTNDFHLVHKISTSPNNFFFFFNGNGKLIKWLKINETYLDINHDSSILRDFDQSEKDNISSLDGNYCFPLVSMNSLIGFLVLEKNKPPLSEKQKELLLTLLSQAALSIKNAQLLKEQQLKLTKMLTADRLAVAGQLASGAAHEIKNPLTAIRSLMQYLQDNPDDKDAQSMMTAVISEVDRIDEIIKGLLTFSKTEIETVSDFNFKVVTQQTLSLIKAQLQKKNINLDLSWKADKTNISGNKNQLTQIILNLILNAAQAIESDGDIAISLDYINDPINNGTYLMRISDTGPGIDKENLSKIFDPFFTTKKEGNGLGLFTVYGIIQKYGGDISVENTGKMGTTFLLKFPEKQMGKLQ
ncbi:MAG: ATP-binding protein [Pseudomonadota bacterium]